MSSKESEMVTEFLNRDYITRAPMLPETVTDSHGDDLLAWKVGRVPEKARLHVVLKLISTFYFRGFLEC